MSVAQNNIQELTKEYVSEAEELSGVENTLSNLQLESFSILKDLYNQYKFAYPNSGFPELENKYKTSEASIMQQRDAHYEKMSRCYKKLAKLRQAETNYLGQLVNVLHKENEELKNKLSALPSEGIAEPSRADNVAI